MIEGHRAPEKRIRPANDVLRGEYHDVETDLFENWNRYYDPSAGRYLQSEPLLTTEAIPRPAFAYAESNPINFVDPNGLAIITGGGLRLDRFNDPTCEIPDRAFARVCFVPDSFHVWEPTPCESTCTDGKTTWKFDALLSYELFINYRSQDSYRTEVYDQVDGRLHTPEHEKRHVADIDHDLSSAFLSSLYKTEGFDSEAQCVAARSAIKASLATWEATATKRTQRRVHTRTHPSH